MKNATVLFLNKILLHVSLETIKIPGHGIPVMGTAGTRGLFCLWLVCGNRLIQLQRAGVQLIVRAFQFDEILVGAALDDAAVIQHHDSVGVAHGGETVCDDKHGTPGHQRVHAALHNGLGAGIDRAGRLVHDHHRRVGHGRTRDGKQLALALAEIGTVAVQHSVCSPREGGG